MASVQTKDYIVQLIKEEILSGVMKPGEELAQEALAERLAVTVQYPHSYLRNSYLIFPSVFQYKN